MEATLVLETDGLTQGRARIAWAVAGRCKPGERVSGDEYLIAAHDGGVLAAVIDGLGHGADAALAAASARAALLERPDEPLDQLMQRCDVALSGTRGAAVTLACFDPTGVRWLAVGNVSAVVVRSAPGSGTKHVPMRGGIVGARIPRMRGHDRVELDAGDIVALATDGLREEFSRTIDTTEPVRDLAGSLLRRCARDSDDALVLVLRHLGDGAACS